MSMSDHIKQQVVQEFFANRSHSSRKWQDWILLFYQSGRKSNYIENMSHILSRGRMAHCFKLLYNVRYRTTEKTAPNGFESWQRRSISF